MAESSAATPELPEGYNRCGRHSFCTLPWVHRFVNLGGEVQLCCTAEEHPDSHLRDDQGRKINISDGLSVDQIQSSRYLKAIRRQMLAGEWPSACERCRVTEQAGGVSRRQHENVRFEPHIPQILEETDADGSTSTRIRSIDYRLGNLCNLRCRMCHPNASKLLLDEWNQVALRRHRISEKQATFYESMDWFRQPGLWEELESQLPYVEHLHFAGGEPLVIPEVFQALQLCVDRGVAGGIELSFNTNATKLPDRMLALWPKFKAVKLLCSVDAFGALNDYIRHPARWSRIAANLQRLDQEHDALNLKEVRLSATVQIYNILKLEELFDYCAKFDFIEHELNLIHLSVPTYFNIQHLPSELKKEAAERLEALHASLSSRNLNFGARQVESIMNFMHMGTSSVHEMRDFRLITERFDALRNESLVDLVPELAPLMQPTAINPLALTIKAASRFGARVKRRLS